MTAYADCEPAITDDRLDPIAEKVRRRYFPWLQDSGFASARVLNTGGVWEVHFLITDLDPRPIQRRFGRDITAIGRTTAKDWDESENEREHFAGKPDPAEMFYMALGAAQAEALQSARSQITDKDKNLLAEFDAMRPRLLN